MSGRQTLLQRQDTILDTVKLIETGITSTTALASRLGVDRKTALAYKAAALKILDTESDHRREGIRSVEVRRINYQIEKLSEEIEALRSSDKKVNHQHYAALLNSLRGYHELLAKITGLYIHMPPQFDTAKRVVINISKPQ